MCHFRLWRTAQTASLSCTKELPFPLSDFEFRHLTNTQVCRECKHMCTCTHTSRRTRTHQLADPLLSQAIFPQHRNMRMQAHVLMHAHCRHAHTHHLVDLLLSQAISSQHRNMQRMQAHTHMHAHCRRTHTHQLVDPLLSGQPRPACSILAAAELQQHVNSLEDMPARVEEEWKRPGLSQACPHLYLFYFFGIAMAIANRKYSWLQLA